VLIYSTISCRPCFCPSVRVTDTETWWLIYVPNFDIYLREYAISTAGAFWNPHIVSLLGKEHCAVFMSHTDKVGKICAAFIMP